MNNDIQKLLNELLGIGLTDNHGYDRTFSEVTNDIRLVFNKLTTSQQEHVVSVLFHQNEKRDEQWKK
ncbi:hypothetical protein [Lysinibacillus pakistanensis]|uniref:DUF3243 family protein n=1 Tax=Lysinibacillus pakistanensis TaxID=759811 RepID=A0ABX6DAC9_9BACI|nr:hypothetical protein GDS87_11825 [Lysinibacillus pakistanensis]